MADDDIAATPPPPPEPPKEEPVPTPVEQIEQTFYSVDGPVTDPNVTVLEGTRAVEAAEMRFFHGTRQGTPAHEAAKQALDEARANLRLARRHRRF